MSKAIKEPPKWLKGKDLELYKLARDGQNLELFADLAKSGDFKSQEFYESQRGEKGKEIKHLIKHGEKEPAGLSKNKSLLEYKKDLAKRLNRKIKERTQTN